MPATLEQLTGAFTEQFARLREWLEPLGDTLGGAAQLPSSRTGWSNRELVVEIGASVQSLINAEPAPSGTTPLSLSEYTVHDSDFDAELTQRVREQAAGLTQGALEYLEEMHTRATANLLALGDDEDSVVLGALGPIRLGDLVRTRLLDLVTYTLDLEASAAGRMDLSAGNTPVHVPALRLVADELLDIVASRGGYHLEVVDARMWTRLATGREPYNTLALTSAIQPTDSAGGVPDLGRVLPLI
ncbi:hypothetical protein [Timonella senegalensis]|uniref:hypothetical protein n=2 Tax=Timonella senegalensis TaxID=1465825 RepID=UPI002FDC8941